MKQLFAVIKNELIRYFCSPLAYVYLISFLILNGSFGIYFGHFIERGRADLSPMFAFQPWLYLLFITGISMRLWSEEFRSKTIMQIMSLPVSTITLVWGKFFASWIFCTIGLLLTFPFVISVNILGNPDNGVIVLGYLGSFIIAGCMLAISQTMSALTKNQVIALVLAVVANLIFFLSGLEYILSAARLFMPSYIVDMIASFSFLTHFDTIISGLLELRDLVFFISIILLFNFTTVLIVDFKTSGTSPFLNSDNKKSYLLVFCAFIIGFSGINLIANNYFRKVQYDFTEEKIYTLDKNTVDIVKNIENPVTIKLYYSPILGKNDESMRMMFDRIKVLLSKYKSLSNGMLDYKIYTPYPFDRIEDLAIGEGLEPVPSVSQNTNAIFGMTFSDSLDNKRTIPFLAPERAIFLEQDISENIYLLSHTKRNLGLITSLPLLGASKDSNMFFEKWEIINQIEKFYNVKTITTSEDISDIDVLLIAHPKNLSDDLKNGIKNYANAGGKALILLDFAPEALRLASAYNGPLEASEFDDLAEFFGFKFYPEYVVADFENSILVDASKSYKTNTNFTNDVIQFILKEKDLSPIAKETSNLNEIMFSSASVVMPASENINFIPLMRASEDSAILPSEIVLKNTNPADILTFYKPDKNAKILAARIFNKDINHPFDIIVVADTDMLYDSFWTKIYNLRESKYIVPILDNANFILNSLEVLVHDNYLLSLRGKSIKNRRFSVIEKLRRNNKLEYSKKELEILNEIDDIKNKLREIWNKKDFENREMFTNDDLLVIKNIRNNLDASRQRLGELRKASNDKLEHLNMLIKFMNIFAVPLLIAFLISISFARKNRNKKSFKCVRSILDKKVAKICLVSLFLLSCGIFSVYFSARSAIDNYEDKPAFSKLFSKINDVKKFSIASNKEKTTLYLDGNDWKIEGVDDFVVSQEQIRSFLSALLEARFYEKKSAKAENLYKFGLLPLEDENSSSLQISLYDSNEAEIETFLLGTYDMDLGRGSKSAYIRFPQDFQVWMIYADLIDVSPKWNDWIINTIWNLKMGRFVSVNNSKDITTVSNMAKILLNTELDKPVAYEENMKKLGEVVLHDENENIIRLNFYNIEEKNCVTYEFLGPVKGYYQNRLKTLTAGKCYFHNPQNWELIEYVLQHIPEKQ